MLPGEFYLLWVSFYWQLYEVHKIWRAQLPERLEGLSSSIDDRV
jgi:hypothetical protein